MENQANGSDIIHCIFVCKRMLSRRDSFLPNLISMAGAGAMMRMLVAPTANVDALPRLVPVLSAAAACRTSAIDQKVAD